MDNLKLHLLPCTSTGVSCLSPIQGLRGTGRPSCAWRLFSAAKIRMSRHDLGHHGRLSEVLPSAQRADFAQAVVQAAVQLRHSAAPMTFEPISWPTISPYTKSTAPGSARSLGYIQALSACLRGAERHPAALRPTTSARTLWRCGLKDAWADGSHPALIHPALRQFQMADVLVNTIRLPTSTAPPTWIKASFGPLHSSAYLESTRHHRRLRHPVLHCGKMDRYVAAHTNITAPEMPVRLPNGSFVTRASSASSATRPSSSLVGRRGWAPRARASSA